MKFFDVTGPMKVWLFITASATAIATASNLKQGAAGDI